MRRRFKITTRKFKRPIWIGETLEVRGTVTSKTDSLEIVTLSTEIWVRGEPAVTGEAKAAFLK